MPLTVGVRLLRATPCYDHGMRTISQREMRNQSGAVLRSVAAGESLLITNNGKPAAVLSPYVEGETPLERLRAAGATRPPQAERQALRSVERVVLDVDTAELLRESRRDY